MKSDYQRPPVRVALMGLGRAMRTDHYRFFRCHPHLFKVVCACDALKERREAVLKDFPDCRLFRRFDDMLDEREIDLVDIATPSSRHMKEALTSLKHGFWTVLEPPLALTQADALVLRGAAIKARERLVLFSRGLFSPDFILARQAMSDKRLGKIYRVDVRKEEFLRRDDWQAFSRLGGGAVLAEMGDLLLQALKLLPTSPVQMWSDLKRLVSVGDAEDFAHVCLRTRDGTLATVGYDGATLAANRSFSFEIRGTRGVFRVAAGASSGTLTVVEPGYCFPRRRSSVRTPSFADLRENPPTVTFPVVLPKDTPHGPADFWRRVYDTVRVAAPFPTTLEETFETMKFLDLMKKVTPFGK